MQTLVSRHLQKPVSPTPYRYPLGMVSFWGEEAHNRNRLARFFEALQAEEPVGSKEAMEARVSHLLNSLEASTPLPQRMRFQFSFRRVLGKDARHSPTWYAVTSRSSGYSILLGDNGAFEVRAQAPCLPTEPLPVDFEVQPLIFRKTGRDGQDVWGNGKPDFYAGLKPGTQHFISEDPA